MLLRVASGFCPISEITSKCGGRLVATCLGKHEHQSAVTPYGHVNLGFTAKDLRRYADKAGLEVTVCESVTREKRPPHFEVLTLLARKP